MAVLSVYGGCNDETTIDRAAVPGVARMWRDPDDVAARAAAVGVDTEPSTGSGDVGDTGDLAGPATGAIPETPAPEPAGGDPEPVPAVEPEFSPASLSEVEALICTLPWPEESGGCAKALRVARCESTDYYAPFNGYHIGAFQVSPIHADIFAAYGWEYYADGDDPYKSAVVALDLLTGANGYWPRHWPNCGWQ